MVKTACADIFRRIFSWQGSYVTLALNVHMASSQLLLLGHFHNTYTLRSSSTMANRPKVVRANVPIVGGTQVQRADAIMHEGGWSRCVLLYPMNCTGELRCFHKRWMTGQQSHDNGDKNTKVHSYSHNQLQREIVSEQYKATTMVGLCCYQCQLGHGCRAFRFGTLIS
jgi:hypothetical protein